MVGDFAHEERTIHLECVHLNMESELHALSWGRPDTKSI